MGTPSLGSTQPRRWLDVAMEAVKKGGCPDAYLRIEPEKGHSISGEDIASSAGQFPRSDIAFGAFIYEPDFEEARIAPIVKAANKHALGQALRAIDRLLKSSSTKDELRTKAEAVKAKIDARIEAAVALTRGLADKDPVLCEFYGRQFMVQLSGHPKQKDVRSILMGNRRKQPYMLALRVWPMFVEKFRGFFGGGPKLNKEAVGFLEQVKTAASESSLLGRMTREFLVMKPPENE